MKQNEKPDIILTEDSKDFETCASMMSKTDPWITLGMNYGDCLKAFEGKGKEIFVLKDAGTIAGFVILQVYGTFSGYIQTICIGKTHRGKGLGTKLLMFCEERILKFSPNIFICVSEFNKGAMKLYYKMGFKLIGKLDNFVKEGFAELLLRKTVGPRAGYQGH
jgi:[ribosomal protein S18]-alanine N-acetyltransferase